MSYKTYSQSDTRWGSKNYNGSSTMSVAGCGPTSCAALIFGIDGKTTPLDTMKYMQKHNFAIRNHGTAWNGIPSCLDAYGFEDAQYIDVSSSMVKVWEHLRNGYIAVFLFKAGTKGGITWTTSGHYLAVTGYKYENKKHYLYMRDSGGRNNTGWFCYETQMKGLIYKVWVGHVPFVEAITKPTGVYSGDLPNSKVDGGYSGAEVKKLQKFLNWYGNFGLTVDGKCGKKSILAIRTYQYTEGLEDDGVFGAKSIAKAKTYSKVGPQRT